MSYEMGLKILLNIEHRTWRQIRAWFVCDVTEEDSACIFWRKVT